MRTELQLLSGKKHHKSKTESHTIDNTKMQFLMNTMDLQKWLEDTHLVITRNHTPTTIRNLIH